MFRKIHWSIALLAILFIGVSGFIYWQWSSVQQLKDEITEDQKQIQENDKPIAQDEQPTTKLVQHDDHFHEVLIDSDDKVQELVQSEDNTKQNEVDTTNLSVDKEFEFSQLPKMSLDIDPDNIPPFYRIGMDGITKFQYNRMLTQEERDMYYILKAEYTRDTPALIKILAINAVRKQKKELGALNYIYKGIADGSLTGVEARQLLDIFYERTR